MYAKTTEINAWIVYAFHLRTGGTRKEFFSDIELIELNSEIASLFAEIRATYNIKTPDAVQLASAIYAKADLFISNDDRLSRFKNDECRVVLLSDF